jgi:hypothetical protein
MLNDFLPQRSNVKMNSVHVTIDYEADSRTPSDLAFSNPEYMCFNELRELLSQKKPSTTCNTTASRTPIRKGHRPVPLPPPARPPPPPPTNKPPPIPPKLYQNVPILTEPIHIECYSLQSTHPTANLLKIGEEQTENNSTFINMTDSTYGSSMILLQSSSSMYNNSDSSTATMIIRSSPEIASRPSKQQLANRLLSPIMTSSRTNLQRGVLSGRQNFDESLLFERNNHRQQGMFLTHSLPFRRTIHHQRQRRLSFDNETLESEQLQQTVQINQTNSTLTQKSFSNFNYDLCASKNQSLNQGSFTASSSSLSGSSSLSSIVLQPPSPFKTSALELPIQTPTKSNLKSLNLPNKQTKKVIFFGH